MEYQHLEHPYCMAPAHNPRPWVIVTNPGQDVEDIWSDHESYAAALAALPHAEEGADVMKRLDDGTLTTGF